MNRDLGFRNENATSERTAGDMRPDRKTALHVFPTFGIGGQQTRFATLANAWGDRWSHHVASIDGDFACAERVEEGVELHIHHLPPRVPGPFDVRAAFIARRVLAEVRPDVLCTYNWGSIEWAAANRIAPLAPHVHFEDGFGPDEADGAFIRRRVLMRRAMFAGGSTVVVPSRTLERVALDVWRLPAERVRRLPNGIDLDVFRPDGDVERLAGPETVVVGAVGALRPEKNIKRLIRTFHRAAEGLDAKLVIVGDGPERGALETAALERGLADRVAFVGAVAGPARFMRGFDIYALSSDTEQMPLGLMEAMACGLPCASTDVGDVAHMLGPESGGVVVPKDAEADYAASLRQLIGDKALRARLGAANRRIALEDYALDAMAERFEGALLAAVRGAEAG